MPKKIELKRRIDIKEVDKYYLRQRGQNLNKTEKRSMLLLIDSGECEYKSELANKLKVNRRTIEIWINKFEEGGPKKLFKLNNRNNANTVIRSNLKRLIIKKLNDPYKQNVSVKEIYDLIKEKSFDIKYSTLYKFVRKYKKERLRR